LACCACGVEGRSEAAHTGTDGGMSMKASGVKRYDFMTVAVGIELPEAEIIEICRRHGLGALSLFG
jgi:hypothetical protein